MLYDGILRFLGQARGGFDKEDPKEFNETINNNLQRAQAIINEMNASLNMTEGGEFAQRMRGLYDYFDRRLQEANIAKTEDGILEVIKHVTVLRDSWAEMLQKAHPTNSGDGASKGPGTSAGQPAQSSSLGQSA
jgi:flagellar protein FliS